MGLKSRQNKVNSFFLDLRARQSLHRSEICEDAGYVFPFRLPNSWGEPGQPIVSLDLPGFSDCYWKPTRLRAPLWNFQAAVFHLWTLTADISLRIELANR